MKIKPSQPSSHTYSSSLPKKTKEPSLSSIVSKALVPLSTKPASLAGRVKQLPASSPLVSKTEIASLTNFKKAAKR
ncbi:MAG: hypothetical protein WCG10_08030 [Chlamydiota bacterium]